MTFLRQAGLLAVVTGALAVAHGADPKPPPPLEQSKQALKELRQDQGRGPIDGKLPEMHGAVPRLDAPVAGPAGLLQPDLKSEQEKKRLQRNQKNWLTDGVKDLEEKKGAGTSREKGTESEETLDPADPEYMLKLYRQQQARRDSESGAPARDETAEQMRPAADPLAPFMKDWLSGSPIDRQVFDTVLRPATGPAAGGASPAAPTGGPLLMPGQSAANPGSNSGLPGLPSSSPQNPYLGLLDQPFLAGLDQMNPAGPPAPLPAPAAVQPATRPPPPPVPETSRTPAANDRKPPPSPLSDDKKYFPQLKRF